MIIDYRRNTSTVYYADQRVADKDAKHFIQLLTAGWQLCVQWKVGSTSWENLANLKKLHPIKCAEYAVSQNLQAKPVFNWWVSYVMKKRKHIISLVNRRPVKRLYIGTFLSYCNVPMIEWSGFSACSDVTLVQIRMSAYND